MTTFYTSYIKSRITYGVQAFSSASQTILSKLEVIQNSAIKIITGLRKSTPIPAIQFESSILPMNTIIKIYVIKYFYKIFSLPKNHIIHKLFREQLVEIERLSWNTLTHKTPLLKQAINICNQFSLPLDLVRNNDYKFNRFFPPPWFSFERVVSTVFIQVKKQDINEEQATQIFNFIKNTTYEHYTKIYTDGSKQINGTVGSAIYIDDITSTFSWKLDSQHTIVTAELFAIYQGIVFTRRNLREDKIVIFSDSLLALTMIRYHENSHLNILTNLIVQEIYNLSIHGIDVVLQWIPSHRGIVGNNIADQIAKEACSYNITTSFPLVFSDFINHFKNKLNSNKIVHWHNIKDNLQFSKSVRDITKWRWLSVNKRSHDVILARLRSRCVQLNDHLHKINLRDSPFCDFCTNKRETVEHFIFECQEYTGHREILHNELANLSINQNEIDLQMLLTGGEGTSKSKLQVLRKFINYIKMTKRFEL